MVALLTVFCSIAAPLLLPLSPLRGGIRRWGLHHLVCSSLSTSHPHLSQSSVILSHSRLSPCLSRSLLTLSLHSSTGRHYVEGNYDFYCLITKSNFQLRSHKPGESSSCTEIIQHNWAGRRPGVPSHFLLMTRRAPNHRATVTKNK